MEALLGLRVLLAELEDLLVAEKQLLPKLYDFVASDGDLFLHVRDEQVLVQLMDVGHRLEIAHRFSFQLRAHYGLNRPTRVFHRDSTGGGGRGTFKAGGHNMLLLLLKDVAEVFAQLLNLFLLLEHFLLQQ